MTGKVLMAFEPGTVLIPVRDLLLVRQVPAVVKKSWKYRQIAVSIRKVGIAQPPVVARHKEEEGKFLLLEGYLRIEVLKELGIDKVTCLVSIDDEAFTYNKQVNRLATIQEHKMLLKLIERGVSEGRIAETLDVNVASIRMKSRLLHGVCPEAAELLEDKHCPINTIRSLKKMKPVRQVEVVELMSAMNNYTVPYANALLAATPPDQLVDAERPKSVDGASREQLARMEREMTSLQRGIKRIESSYGPDHLHLVLATGYTRSLLGNAKIARYLNQHHTEIGEELVKISKATATGSEVAE